MRSKIENKEKSLSLQIESKFTQWMSILFGLFSLAFSIYLIHIDWTKGNFSLLSFIFFPCAIILIYFLYKVIFQTDFSIELDDKKLTIKRPFNKMVTIKYNEISEVNISYGIIVTTTTTSSHTPNEHIVISRKLKKPVSIAIDRSKIKFQENSNFRQCISFLSMKVPLTIHIHNFYRKTIVKNKFKSNAKLEWSDFPNIFDKMK
jgi:hypothetical protein